MLLLHYWPSWVPQESASPHDITSSVMLLHHNFNSCWASHTGRLESECRRASRKIRNGRQSALFAAHTRKVYPSVAWWLYHGAVHVAIIICTWYRFYTTALLFQMALFKSLTNFERDKNDSCSSYKESSRLCILAIVCEQNKNVHTRNEIAMQFSSLNNRKTSEAFSQN